MNDSLFAAGQPVTYQRYTNNDFVPARVLGPSKRGEQYIHIVYERNGHKQEHHAPLERVSFPIRSPSPSDGAPSPPLSHERGRSPTRSTTPAARCGPAPAAPLPMGWELRTTKDGIPYYVDHVRGATTWERPVLPSYEQVARPLPKHRLPAAKHRVVSGPLDKYFPKGCAASTSGSVLATSSTGSAPATSPQALSSTMEVGCVKRGTNRRRSKANSQAALKRIHRSHCDKVRQ